MASFKRTFSLSGKFKGIISNGQSFIEQETGEVIDLADILNKVYGDNAFDISTKYGTDDTVESEDVE